MPRVTHFEIHADDPQRAIDFYTRVFGWTFEKWDGGEGYWMVKTGEEPEPGIDGGLVQRRAPIDGSAVISFVSTIEVPEIDRFMELVADGGGEIAVPKMEIPGVGWLAYGKDTEGNLFGMFQTTHVSTTA